MRLVIAGSRTLSSISIIDYVVKHKLKIFKEIKVVISGKARGIDTSAIEWAKLNNIPCEIYVPNWATGKQAGYVRNTLMAQKGDAVLVFWDGISGGSQHMYQKMLKFQKPAVLYKVNRTLGKGFVDYTIEGDDTFTERKFIDE